MSSEDMKIIEAPASEHYCHTNAQPIDLLDTELKRGFYVGNILKYVARYRYKDGIKDLRKAQTYLSWLIRLEEDSWNEEMSKLPVKDLDKGIQGISVKCANCKNRGSHDKCVDYPVDGCQYYIPECIALEDPTAKACWNCKCASLSNDGFNVYMVCSKNGEDYNIISDPSNSCPKFTPKQEEK